jgi:proline iminopeptidase
LVAAAPAAAQGVPANDSAKVETIRKLFAITRVEAYHTQIMSQASVAYSNAFASTPIPAELVGRMRAFLDEHGNFAAVENDLISVYREFYSETEAQQLLRFYESPLGQRLVTVTPAISARMYQVTSARMTALMPKLLQEPNSPPTVVRATLWEFPREVPIPVDGASLYTRVLGRGRPMIVLHGGPDFDTGYLLPDLDRLQDSFRLFYYDQRGRGQSAASVKPEDVTLASDLADLERVRRHFKLDAPVVLGHSWGAVLALEYALRHPDRVSHLILMNPAPASAVDLAGMRKHYLSRLGADMESQREIMAGAGYQSGDPGAVAARYRIHFKPALSRSQDYEKLMATMQAGFVKQGREGILKARAVEDRLMLDTWQKPGYDLLSALKALRVPTLVLTGAEDFIPVGIAANIASAIPGAHLEILPGCGHFIYLECPAGVRSALDRYFRSASGTRERH